MIKIISLVMHFAAVVAGVGIGLTLKSQGSSSTSEAASEHNREAKDKHSDSGNKDKKSKKGKKKKADTHGKAEKYGGGGESDIGFVKFSRQFIVPVVTHGNVNSLVIIDVNLEVDPAKTEKAYAREPKLRDAILSALLELSNEGTFEDHLLEKANMDLIRARLLEASQAVIEDDIYNILIVSIARKEL